MPLEEQTTQAIKEGTEAVARVAVRLTAHGAQALIQAVLESRKQRSIRPIRQSRSIRRQER